MRALYFLLIGFFIPLYSEETPPILPIEGTGIENPFGAQFMKMIFILSCMVAFLILLSWLTKKLSQPRLMRQNALSKIQVIEGRSLSHKALVWLIEVEGERILVGESAQGLVKLMKVGEKSCKN